MRFNPVLLKPGSDRTSQLVIKGQVAESVTATSYVQHRDRLAALVLNELTCLRDEFDAVICEGRVRRPKSTCVQRIWPIWAWPGPPISR